MVDDYVVDASEFITEHPGGLNKLLATDKPKIGATGEEFGFSFSRGKNSHFPDTAKSFREGLATFLRGEGGGVEGSEETAYLPPAEVEFPPYGSIVILGKLVGA